MTSGRRQVKAETEAEVKASGSRSRLGPKWVEWDVTQFCYRHHFRRRNGSFLEN